MRPSCGKMPRMAQKWREEICRPRSGCERSTAVADTPQPLARAALLCRHRPQTAHSSRKTSGSEFRRWQRDCSLLSASPAPACVLPRLPDRFRSEIRDGFTESVPKAFCCCKLLIVSIHWGYGAASFSVRPCFLGSAVAVLGTFWGYALLAERSGHATEFTGTADDAAL